MNEKRELIQLLIIGIIVFVAILSITIYFIAKLGLSLTAILFLIIPLYLIAKELRKISIRIKSIG